MIIDFLTNHKRGCPANRGTMCTCGLYKARAELYAAREVIKAAREVTIYNSEYMVRMAISRLAAALAKLKHGNP